MICCTGKTPRNISAKLQREHGNQKQGKNDKKEKKKTITKKENARRDREGAAKRRYAQVAMIAAGSKAGKGNMGLDLR